MELFSQESDIFGYLLLVVLIICWVLNIIICFKLIQAGKELNNKSLRWAGWLSFTIICIQTILVSIIYISTVYQNKETFHIETITVEEVETEEVEVIIENTEDDNDLNYNPNRNYLDTRDSYTPQSVPSEVYTPQSN